MSKSLNSLFAEVENSLKQYKQAGLIDPVSMYRWANLELRRFGTALCEIYVTSLRVENGRANLPKNFHSLYFAMKCFWKGFHAEEKDIPLLQKSLVWQDKVETHRKFNPCDPCCYEETEKIVEEREYYNGKMFSVYYDNPVPLRLTKHVHKNEYADDCLNYKVRESPYEISINKFTVHTNFNEGIIYLQYYGLPQDENKSLLIPETPRGVLETYLEYHLKRRVLEDIMLGGDDPNTINQYKMMREQEIMMRPLAEADVKFMTLTPDSYRKIKNRNTLNLRRIESLTGGIHPRFRRR